MIIASARWLPLSLAMACFNPDYVEGLQCSDNQDCPPDQACIVPEYVCRLYEGSGSSMVGCDLVIQTGCSSDQKCTIDRMVNPMRVCMPDGTGGVGELCDGIGELDTCARGLACLYGTCHAFCDITSDQPPCGADTCGSFFGYAACMTACEPLAPACPMAGDLAQNCYMDPNGKTQCVPTNGNLPSGSGCSFSNQCTGGTVCHLGVCRAYCDYAATPNQQGSCTASLTCQAFYSNVGVCR